MPFTFIFKGSFEELAHLLGQVEGFAQRTHLRRRHCQRPPAHDPGRRRSRSKTATPAAHEAGSRKASSNKAPLTATITATAYVLPATQGLTGGATAAGPSGAQNAYASGSSGSAATPAVVKVTP